MKFDNLKFVVLRKGSNSDLKENTKYFTDEMSEVIQPADNHRDQGVLMSTSGEFGDHISNVIRTVRKGPS